MDLKDFEKPTLLGERPTKQYEKNSTVLKHIENVVETLDNNMKRTTQLINKLGKVNDVFLTAIPNYALRKNRDELMYDLIRPAVLVEKTGNHNKGIVNGQHIDYDNCIKQRIETKKNKNVFYMWLKGEIKDSIVIDSECGFVRNKLTDETFYGCNYPFKLKIGEYTKLGENL